MPSFARTLCLLFVPTRNASSPPPVGRRIVCLQAVCWYENRTRPLTVRRLWSRIERFASASFEDSDEFRGHGATFTLGFGIANVHQLARMKQNCHTTSCSAVARFD